METKNDLSFNKVKLDYQALKKTTQIAVISCIKEIEDHKNKIYNYLSKNDNTAGLYLSARYLKDEAEKLIICTETFHTILGMEEREELEIVNK